MRKAGSQDSGLFFCASYENWVVFFLTKSRNVGKHFRSRWSSSCSGLQLAPILLIHKASGLRPKFLFPVWERSLLARRFFT
jgi:hypothetical protein